MVGFAEHLTSVGQCFQRGCESPTPLLQRVVQTEAQTVGVVPSETDANGARQREDVAQRHGIARLDGAAADALVVEIGTAVQIVAQTVDQSQRELVVTTDALRPLRTQVDRIGAHLVGVGATQGVGRSRTELCVGGVGGGAPKIAGIHTQRKTAERHIAQAGIHLVEAAVAGVAGGRSKCPGTARTTQTCIFCAEFIAHTAEGAQA